MRVAVASRPLWFWEVIYSSFGCVTPVHLPSGLNFHSERDPEQEKALQGSVQAVLPLAYVLQQSSGA